MSASRSPAFLSKRVAFAAVLCIGFCSGALSFPQNEATAAREKRRITALRVEPGAIVVDGELTEPEWTLAEPAKDFTQSEPLSGEPATEATEARILYDHRNLYVGIYCFDSRGSKGLIVTNMERDFDASDGDMIQFVLDTFLDGRNGFAFATNPEGSLREMQVGGDGLSYNREWDAVWDVKTKKTDLGWQAEFVIPFKSLRFNREEDQLWGINFERRIRRKNERANWAPIPPQFRVYRVSLAGILEGISGIRQGNNLYVKPYVTAPIVRRENDDVDFLPEAGLDVKYGVTSGLALDLTLNTDFSQVEADDAQINFTRFSLFFPEKRDFFLENQEVFEFGNTGTRGISGRSSRYRPRNDLIPFFSRRIGIVEGEEDENGEETDDRLVPILGGARMTGRVGNYRMGILTMQTDDLEKILSTNFTVGRLRRDVLESSDVGVIFVNKLESDGYFNRTYGADANFRFFDALDLSSYFLKSDTTGVQGKDKAGFFRAAWTDRLFDIEASHISIEDNYIAEVGFVPREGIRKTSGEFSLTPRPEGKIPWVREFRPSIQVDYITNQENELETRELQGRFFVEFNDSSYASVSRRSTFERLFEDDDVLDVPLAAGDYNFAETMASFSTDRSRMFSGSASWSSGQLFNGDRSGYSIGLGFSPNPHFTADILWNHSDVVFPTEEVTTDLVSTRLAYSFTTNMFLNALIQYSSEDGFVASNIRFNLIHKPLSDFFLVYNESRTPDGEVLDRALIAKLTYLFSF